jgi:transcriptional regulator with XRE-family HTH domain
MEQKSNWLKTLREQNQITQEELAVRLQLQGMNTSRSSIASWETGKHDPPLNNREFRIALSQILRVSIKSMLKMAGYEVDQEHTALGERAASIIDQMPEDKQQLAIKLLEQLV